MVDKSKETDNQKDKNTEAEETVNQEEVQNGTSPEEESEENQENVVEEEEKEPTLEEKLAELQDRYLRLSAEYDNFRKRTLKEKIDLQKSANLSLLNDLLPVADDFDRALGMVNEASDMDAVKEGINLISGKFSGFLAQQGVKEIDTTSREFDTDLHEAITKIPAPSKKLKGKVVDVVQKGYYLNDKVLRFAKVVIGE
ncbi:MAG: nucleotide exchange factor GrpE [Bacteroidales bacterium]